MADEIAGTSGRGDRQYIMASHAVRMWVVAFCLAPSWSYAQDWKITPHISVFQSFTSNARLAPPGEEESDFFTTASPGIDIHRESPSLNFDLSYALDAIAYVRDEELSELRNRLQFVSTATIAPELLFLDARAAMLQQPDNSRRTGSGSALAGSTNLETVKTYSISPYLLYHFGSIADSEIRYSFNQTYSDDLSDSTAHRVNVGLTSGSRFSRIRTTLQLSGEEISESREISTRLAELSAEYRLSREVGLLGSVGYERIEDPTLDDEPDGPIGGAGIQLKPGPRSSVTLLYQHRFDSDFFSGEARYVIGPRTWIDASYSESIETSNSLFADNLDFLTRDEFGNYVDSRTARLFSLDDTGFGLEENAFRLKVFDLGLHLVRGRNTFDLVAYHERRDTDATDEKDTAFGGALNWQRQISPLSRLDFTARYRHGKFDDGTQDDTVRLIGAGASFIHSLNENLDGVVALSYLQQLSDEREDEFSEGVVSIGLTKRF
jgi:uncharacterized protein (PEP-CTERM system associated)